MRVSPESGQRDIIKDKVDKILSKSFGALEEN
jgi:hypothetical protein